MARDNRLLPEALVRPLSWVVAGDQPALRVGGDGREWVGHAGRLAREYLAATGLPSHRRLVRAWIRRARDLLADPP
jgi:uracil-DNA glycosylase